MGLGHLVVEEIGFEPMKAVPTDLQSVPFSHSGTLPKFYFVFQELVGGLEPLTY